MFFSFALIVNALSIIANGKNLVFLTLNFHFSTSHSPFLLLFPLPLIATILPRTHP